LEYFKTQYDSFQFDNSFCVVFTFINRTYLCGYDLNLSYPETVHYPSLTQPYDMPGYGIGVRSALALSGGDGLQTSAYRKRGLLQHIQNRFEKRFPEWDVAGRLRKRTIQDRSEQKQAWKKRALTDRANGTIDAWYGCYLLNELAEYAVNYTFPWGR
jgi:carboxypeptidase D